MAAGQMSAVSAMASAAAAVTDSDAPPAAGLFNKVLETAKGVLSNKERIKQLLGTLRVTLRSAFNPLEFSRPATQTEWMQRVRTNGLHFKQLYGIVFLVCLVYTILRSHPPASRLRRLPAAPRRPRRARPVAAHRCCSSAC